MYEYARKRGYSPLGAIYAVFVRYIYLFFKKLKNE